MVGLAAPAHRPPACPSGQSSRIAPNVAAAPGATAITPCAVPRRLAPKSDRSDEPARRDCHATSCTSYTRRRGSMVRTAGRLRRPTRDGHTRCQARRTSGSGSCRGRGRSGGLGPSVGHCTRVALPLPVPRDFQPMRAAVAAAMGGPFDCEVDVVVIQIPELVSTDRLTAAAAEHLLAALIPVSRPRRRGDVTARSASTNTTSRAGVGDARSGLG